MELLVLKSHHYGTSQLHVQRNYLSDKHSSLNYSCVLKGLLIPISLEMKANMEKGGKII